MSYITEAFKALDALNEETFSVSDDDGIKKLADFENDDDVQDEITIFDMDAEDENDLEDSYIGKVILDCCVCHSKIYKDKSEVSIDEEQGLANIDMECPYCYSQEGFKVIGEVAPMTAEESTSETSAETDTDSIQESLKESYRFYGSDKTVQDYFNNVIVKAEGIDGASIIFTNYLITDKGKLELGFIKLPDGNVIVVIPSFDYQWVGDWDSALEVYDTITEEVAEFYDIETFVNSIEGDPSPSKIDKIVRNLSKSEVVDLNESKSIKEAVDKTLDKAIDKYFDGEVRDYKVNGDKVDVTFKDGSQKTFNKSIFDESLNEASTDRVQKLLSIIDNSFEVLEDAPINEDALEEAKQIRLSSIPGVTRDPSNDFTDDGNRFQAYLYKGVVPITYLRAGGDVYITIAFHHLEDINFEEYREFPSYKHADEFNGVPVDDFNLEVFQRSLESAYDDIVKFRGGVQEVDSDQLEDRIKVINAACKEYEEKVKQYIQDNALKIMKLSDYEFRTLKSYVSSAGSRTADYIRNATADSKRHFMYQDVEQLKRQISHSWNFEYIEDILNSVEESLTESPVLSQVGGTLGHALDVHKDELANATTSEALVELLNKIRPEVKEGQQAYLDSVIERVKRLPAIKGMQFVYNLILKGDGMSTNLDAAKPRKKAANESLQEVEVKTGDTKVEVSSDKDGKITVSSEPCEAEETSEDNAEVIEPLSDETRSSIETDETDVDIDDMDTDAFDELGESYLKRVYENVSTYKTLKVSTQDNKFLVEGLITFDSGNQKATSFVFESANCTKDGKLKFIGENMQIVKGEKAFSLIGSVDGTKFITESFNYNYRTKNNIGKSTRVYGTIRRK